LGVLLGLLLLTKLTLYVLVALAVLATCWYETRRHGWKALSSVALSVLALPLAMALPWYVRNVLVYGWPDVLGQLRHNMVVVGQPRVEGWDLAHVQFLVRVTFQSFWGQFGWMGVVMPDWIYRSYALLMGAWLLGLVVHMVA